MQLNFKPLTAKDMSVLEPYYFLRHNRTCDSVFLESFIWKDFYNVRYAIWEDRALLWLMENNGKYFSAMPLCREEELPAAFKAIETYFNEALGYPLVINLADAGAVEYLALPPEQYLVAEQEDSRDYIYSGDSLRSLSGRKLHKKKNRVNAFMRQYEGRYEYRRLGCDSRDEVWKFLDRWRLQKGDSVEEHLDFEVSGIHDILRNCCELNAHMGGIYIDGRLEAFSIGSYNPLESMAVIHIEKANPEINGLYQVINQQFLIHEFPQAQWVNREDDMGLEGLRAAKMSYNPADFARKYLIEQLEGRKEGYRWAEKIDNTAAGFNSHTTGANEKADRDKADGDLASGAVQEMTVSYLDRADAGLTRPLWEQCFPEDGPDFLDYYYAKKVTDNQILAGMKDGQIVSMLHRNPYTVQVLGRKMTLDYIVAVATRADCRGRGYMGCLLTKALKDMCREGRPFTFLMPAAEAIYTPYGFRMIGDTWEPDVAAADGDVTAVPAAGDGNVTAVPAAADGSEDAQIACWMQEWMTAFDVHTERDENYVSRLRRELKSDGGVLYVLKKAGQIAGLKALWGKDGRELRFFYAGQALGKMKRAKPSMMGRITNAETFLTLFGYSELSGLPEKSAQPEAMADLPYRLILRLHDPQLSENNGDFLWTLRQGGSVLERLKPQEKNAGISSGYPVLEAQISDLALWLFGREALEQLWPEFAAAAPAACISVLNELNVIRRVCLDEAV